MVVKRCFNLIVGLIKTSPGIVLAYSQVWARVLGQGEEGRAAVVKGGTEMVGHVALGPAECGRCSPGD